MQTRPRGQSAVDSQRGWLQLIGNAKQKDPSRACWQLHSLGHGLDGEQARLHVPFATQSSPGLQVQVPGFGLHFFFFRFLALVTPAALSRVIPPSTAPSAPRREPTARVNASNRPVSI
jgi:hypothetical protein